MPDPQHMSIDRAVAILGVDQVHRIVNSGHAPDEGHPDSFDGRATAARIRGHLDLEAACRVLRGTPEITVRWACWPEDALIREFKDGSGRAMAEIRRRGLAFPVPADCQPAYL